MGGDKCRKSKLEAAVKVKERTLAAQQRKPDPMQGAAALQSNITRLNNQLEMAVSTSACNSTVSQELVYLAWQCAKNPETYLGACCVDACNPLAAREAHKRQAIACHDARRHNLDVILAMSVMWLRPLPPAAGNASKAPVNCR